MKLNHNPFMDWPIARFVRSNLALIRFAAAVALVHSMQALWRVSSLIATVHMQVLRAILQATSGNYRAAKVGHCLSIACSPWWPLHSSPTRRVYTLIRFITTHTAPRAIAPGVILHTRPL